MFALIPLVSLQVHAGVEVKHEEFSLTLPDGWNQVHDPDPERWAFESGELGSSAVFSILPGMRIPKDRLTEAAQRFATIRKDAEQRARPGQRITYGDEWVELKPGGDVAEVAYAAFDESGTIFRFVGFVTQVKVLSLWVAT
ncbi:MAG: hypothetical protein ACXWVJ_04120, partial [Caulobacteraceae bacterium]